MFNKVDKDKVQETNKKVSEEIHQTKPDTNKEDNKKGREITGKVVSSVGTTVLAIGGVGALSFFFAEALALTGLSAVILSILLIIGGIACLLIGNKIQGFNPFNQVLGV